MSALLNLEATEINILAEYGYSTRNFEKRPRVVISDDYKSCLFLVYQQSEALPNRKRNYHNHFTLFRSKRRLVVVRAETTMILQDNDAILTYDVIEPLASANDRFRTTSKPWCVSFDRITYSNARPPSFVEHELVCSGEWWFYDRGIILNGVTRYAKGQECKSMFIYFELHPRYLVRPKAQLLNTAAASAGGGFFGFAPNLARAQSLCVDGAQQSQPEAQPQQSDTQQATATTAATTTTTSGNNVDTAFTYPRPSNTRLFVSTLATSILPQVTASSRTLVTRNDSRDAPDIQYEAIMPSLYWFNTRASELKQGNIDYFLPQNYMCAS